MTLTHAQDEALRDAIRSAFADIPGHHVGPVMNPLMRALRPVIAQMLDATEANPSEATETKEPDPG